MQSKIAIIGLGYVGLPLAVEFGKKYDTVGFDIDTGRVAELRAGKDRTGETESNDLAAATRLRCTSDRADLVDCNVYIITVPTPIDAAKRPDLTPLVKASETVGGVLKDGDVVIYESTVYPGCTEEVCVPILERVSGLRFEAAPLPTSPRTRGEEQGRGTSPRTRGEEQGRGTSPRARGEESETPIVDQGLSGLRPLPQNTAPVGGASAPTSASHSSAAPPEPGPLTQDTVRATGSFTVGYSPERINPGDAQRRLTTIVKVTSGSTPEAADLVDALYSSIITAGTHKASSIKVAEAAKVIENTQRDLNIALINDLAILFNKLGIDTLEVLEAAGTKWNFLPFRPGLVGGHCIGVDPYYLTHKAQEVGHHPQVILAGRRTNDGMGTYVADRVLKLMLQKGINPVGARMLMLGLAFKENCPDTRNTRVVDIIATLQSCSVTVDVYDPWVDGSQARVQYGIDLIGAPEPASYDAIILAVAHHQFQTTGITGIRAWGKDACVIYDVKGVLPREKVDERL